MTTGDNRKAFLKLSEEELSHYRTLKEYTKAEAAYTVVAEQIPKLRRLVDEEDAHEKIIMERIDKVALQGRSIHRSSLPHDGGAPRLSLLRFGERLFRSGLVLLDGLLVIGIFIFFTSVVRGLPYRKILFEMASIGLGVAAISFLIGWLARFTLGMEA